MALNPFFRQEVASEQRLVQDLVNEHLRMYGQEVYYMPRKYLGTDSIMRENTLALFDDAYAIEAYVANVEGFQGSGDLMSKFGIRVTDEATFIISKERFEDYVADIMANVNASANQRKGVDTDYFPDRPMEGDLVYFPLTDSLFEVKFVEHESPFYQLGQLYTYELRCELFEYEQEIIDTDFEDIDNNVASYGYTVTLNMAGTGIQATANVGVRTGSVHRIVLENDGYGYSTIPTVAISTSPNGSAAANATAVAIGTVGSGSTTYSIQSIEIINTGFGYTVAPTVTVVGDGSGVKAKADISSSGVLFVTGFTGGNGYSVNANVGIPTSPVGVTSANASARAIVTNGVVSGIRFTNAGFGYTVGPSISIDTPYRKRIAIGIAGITTSVGTYTTTGITTASLGIGTTVVGIATTVGTLAANPTTEITGIDTTGIQIGDALQVGLGISDGTFVTSIGSTSAPDVVTVGLALTVGIGSTVFTITRIGSTGIDITTSFSTSFTTEVLLGNLTSINLADPGIGYTVAPTVTIGDPSGFNSGIITAVIGIGSTVQSLTINNGGTGYGVTPVLRISDPSAFRVGIITVGISTLSRISGVATASGTVSIGDTTTITGIGTTGISIGDIISDVGPLVSAGTTVLSIGINSVTSSIGIGIGTTEFTFSRTVVTGIGSTLGSITVNNGGEYYQSAPTLSITGPGTFYGVGVGSTAKAVAYINSSGIITGAVLTSIGYGYSTTDVIEVTLTGGIGTATAVAGINTVGVITTATLTNAGLGYTTIPTVTIIGGITTATAISYINASGIVTGTSITNSGFGYTTPPSVTFSEPRNPLNTGDYVLNEMVTGQTGLATAHVKNWNAVTRELKVYSVAGNFALGELVVGSAGTVATGNTSHVTGAYILESIEYDQTDVVGTDAYADNKEFQDAADDIIDWNETNPFGTF